MTGSEANDEDKDTFVRVSRSKWYDLAKGRILGPCDSNSLTTYGPVDIEGPGKFLLSERSQLAGNSKVAHNNRELTTGVIDLDAHHATAHLNSKVKNKTKTHETAQWPMAHGLRRHEDGKRQ